MTVISAVRGNGQRLDGGAMFGNAPKALWSRYCPPDAENRIELACRALLVERQRAGKKECILLETGIGCFFAPALRSRYGVVESDHVLLTSLQSLGFSDADITHVVLSHLHFDHAGGLLSPYAGEAPPRLLFPNARYLVSEEALHRARHPHSRDRASFIPELPRLLDESGRLHTICGRAASDPLLPGLRFHYSDGHTPGLMLTEVFGEAPDASEAGGQSVVFLGDLVPGTPWVHLPMTMGYDRFPELLIDEKSALLEDLCQRRAWLFYTHDLDVAMSRVNKSPEGRMVPADLQIEVIRRTL